MEQKDLVALYQVKVVPIQLLLQSLSKHCLNSPKIIKGVKKDFKNFALEVEP